MTTTGRLLTLASLLPLLAVAPAGARERWEVRTEGVLVAPEGTVAYAADYRTLVRLARDPETGALRYDDLPGARADGARTYEMTPDARALLTSDGGHVGAAVRTLWRNPDGTLRPGPQLPGEGVLDIAVTGDGRTVLLSEDTPYGSPASVHVVRRDPATGEMASDGRVALPGSPHSGRAAGLAIAPDDRFAYVAGRTDVHVLALADGPPHVVHTVPRPDLPLTDLESLALSPDGERLYAGPRNLAVFAVDRATGGLSALAGTDFGYTSSYGHETHRDVAVSPDGASVFVTDRETDVLHQAAPTAGGAAHVRTLHNFTDAQGLDGPGAVTVSPDGRSVYVGAFAGGAEATGGRVVVFRRDPATNALTFGSAFQLPDVPKHPYGLPGMGCPPAGCPNPAGVTTVSINDGAQYTNDRNVTLTIDPGAPAEGFAVDNDGGMRNAKRLPGRADKRYPWTLASTGPERLPKTVYVRPAGMLIRSGPMAIDDIVLDETEPVVVAADPVGVLPLRRTARAAARVRVVARDRASGVARLQLARTRSRPLPWRRARARTVVALPRGARWVRVRDRAGNASRWRRIERSR